MNLQNEVKKYRNLADYLDQSLIKYSDESAYVCLGQTLSFKDVDEKSYALACYFQQKLKLQQGDRIIIQLPNLIQYPIAVYAAMRAGLVVVNTNPLYTPREMLHQFNDSGAKAIVILEDLMPKLDGILDRTSIKHSIMTNADDLISGNIVENGFNEAIEKGKNLILATHTMNLADVAVIQYTGGTTGLSKGAVLTHSNLLSNIMQTSERLSIASGETQEQFVTPLPLYHIYAFLLNLWVIGRGNTNILIPNPRDIDGFIESISHCQPTAFSGINTLFLGLCSSPNIASVDFSKLKLTISGGAALTTSAAKSWKQVTGCTISEGYGLSETSPVATLNPPKHEQIGSIGLPVLDTEIKIWDDNEQEVPQGETGELVIRGPQVMQGYWQQVEETNKVLTKDGWFKTGDIAIAQADGFFRIVDRKKDMIIVSGFNVYPNEIEDVLASHPAILESAVVGEPSEKTGELVSAFIVIASNMTLTQAEVDVYCREQLTAYKVPKKITFMDELPKSSVGKILRKDLRQ